MSSPCRVPDPRRCLGPTIRAALAAMLVVAGQANSADTPADVPTSENGPLSVPTTAFPRGGSSPAERFPCRALRRKHPGDCRGTAALRTGQLRRLSPSRAWRRGAAADRQAVDPRRSARPDLRNDCAGAPKRDALVGRNNSGQRNMGNRGVREVVGRIKPGQRRRPAQTHLAATPSAAAQHPGRCPKMMRDPCLVRITVALITPRRSRTRSSGRVPVSTVQLGTAPRRFPDLPACGAPEVDRRQCISALTLGLIHRQRVFDHPP